MRDSGSKDKKMVIIQTNSFFYKYINYILGYGIMKFKNGDIYEGLW